MRLSECYVVKCQVFDSRRLSFHFKETRNTGTGKGLLKNELNVVDVHVGSSTLNRSCDPYSILKSLLSCFATKETMAHPSIWKQERKVMCSGGGCYCTYKLLQKQEARFVWTILICTFKFGNTCGVKNDYIYFIFLMHIPGLMSMIHLVLESHFCFFELAEPARSTLDCENMLLVLWERVLEMKSSSSDLQVLQVSDALIAVPAHSRSAAVLMLLR